jgi:hypothetical protein
LRMRRSSKSMSSSASSARSGAGRGIGARTRVAHCGWCCVPSQTAAGTGRLRKRRVSSVA